MAGIWCVRCHRRQDGHSHVKNPDMVCLYIFFNNGFSTDHLFCPCLLDEYKALHSLSPQKSFKISLIRGAFFVVTYEESQVFVPV